MPPSLADRDIGAFVRKLGVTTLSQVVALGLMVSFVMLATRWLGAADRGHQAFLVSAGQIAAILFGFGVSSALPAAVALDRRRLSAALRTVGATTAMAAACVALTVVVVHQWELAPEADGHGVLLVVFVAANVAQQALTVLAVSAGDMRTYNLTGILSGAVALLVLFGLRSARMVTVGSVIGAQTLALVVASAWSSINILSLQMAERVPLAMRRLAGAAILGLLSNLFGIAMLRGDLIVVSRLAGMADAGVYSVAVFVGELTLRIPQWAAQLHTPAVAADPGAASVKRTVELFVAAIVVTSCVFVLATIGRRLGIWVLSRVAGAEFGAAYDMLLALGPRFVMQSGVAILAAFLAGRHYTLFHPAATLAGLCGVVGLDLVLVPRWGAMGASIASSVGFSGAAAIFVWGFLVHGGLSFREFASIAIQSPRRLLASRKGQ